MPFSMTSRSSTPAREPPEITLKTVVLDTDDPAGLAEFYTALLGWRVTWADEEWVTIRGDGEVAMAFQLVLNYRAPTFPDVAVPQQIHIDFRVRDLPAAAAYAESIGARPVRKPVEGGGFRSFLDPSGHPFCLSPTAGGG
jgi:predicted enzyme related to lactoylglutathione lyase